MTKQVLIHEYDPHDSFVDFKTALVWRFNGFGNEMQWVADIWDDGALKGSLEVQKLDKRAYATYFVLQRKMMPPIHIDLGIYSRAEIAKREALPGYEAWLTDQLAGLNRFKN